MNINRAKCCEAFINITKIDTTIVEIVFKKI